MTSTEAKFEFDPATRKHLIVVRDKLQYAPFGIVTAVAKVVGVRRQYAHSVIFEDDTFDKYRSEKAQRIWYELEKKVADNKYVPVIEKVVKALRDPEGPQVELKMSSRLFAFLKRRLARLGVHYSVGTDDAIPATYTFHAIKPVALARQ